MKIRMFLRPGIWLFLIAVVGALVIEQQIGDGDIVMAVILICCAIFTIYLAILCYQSVLFSKNKLTVINSYAKLLPLSNKIIIPYSEISFIYFATIKEGSKSSQWIILCRQDQQYRRINQKDLITAIRSDSFVAFKYSKRRERILLNLFNGYHDIIIEYMDVNNSTGERLVRSSRKTSLTDIITPAE